MLARNAFFTAALDDSPCVIFGLECRKFSFRHRRTRLRLRFGVGTRHARGTSSPYLGVLSHVIGLGSAASDAYLSLSREPPFRRQIIQHGEDESTFNRPRAKESGKNDRKCESDCYDYKISLMTLISAFIKHSLTMQASPRRTIFALKVVNHSTPSCLLICSIILLQSSI